MADPPSVRVRRVYDDPHDDDGARVLVDRIWPRGISKENAHLDEWCKEVAPSAELRKWYNHDPEKFDEFRSRYSEELKAEEPAAALEHLREICGSGALTLLTASKAADISQAAVLAKILSS